MAVLILLSFSWLVLGLLAPGLWWIVTTYGWDAIPAFGLLLKGKTGTAAGSARKRALRPAPDDKERELLEVLRKEGEISAVRAALGTSLTVAEADRMLRELAEGGHLQVRVRGGGLFYALWGGTPIGESGAQ